MREPPTQSSHDETECKSSRNASGGTVLDGDIPQPSAVEEGLCEKSSSLKENTRVWPPWKRRDGWAGWGRESIGTASLVPSLVVQAFSTGILDATTYADFNTFASNRKSVQLYTAIFAR